MNTASLENCKRRPGLAKAHRKESQQPSVGSGEPPASQKASPLKKGRQ
jgi:hypothetical protein